MISLTRIMRYAVGSKDNGNCRVYIQNHDDLGSINFIPHARYTVSNTTQEFVLTLNESGEKKVIESKKGASIIELCDKKISKFIGQAKFVSVKLKENEIRIRIEHTEKKRMIRERNFNRNIKSKSITTGSIYSGTGFLTYVMHEGLKRAGFNPKIRFATDFDETASHLNTHYNPIWKSATKDASFVMDDLQTMDMDLMPTYVDNLEIAQPCTSYSALCPKDKKDIDHPITGKLFIPTINTIAKMNPATITLECTPKLLESNAFKCIEDALIKMGYVFETIFLRGKDFGDFEERKRFCLFAVSKGLKHLFPKLSGVLSLSSVNTRRFAEIKEDIPLDSPLWKTYDHVKKRDTITHLGYRNCLVQDDAISMPALVATYNSPKAGSPFVPHPTDNKLQRKISVKEHTLIRKFPSTLADAVVKLSKGLLKGQKRTNEGKAHMVCGNSVSPSPFEALMYYMFSGLHNSNEDQLRLPL